MNEFTHSFTLIIDVASSTKRFNFKVVSTVDNCKIAREAYENVYCLAFRVLGDALHMEFANEEEVRKYLGILVLDERIHSITKA